ncbi:alpha/beta-hydrolase [Rickenella mellea]|uniref:Alpha/beta-hydrolase n=1 Tax=Rickenella mellea TaxID=50990 RepID=A0A4Y7PYY9_9AGAM|nr:alpha/beta-hydrolase [Rickenella mellea]
MLPHHRNLRSGLCYTFSSAFFLVIYVLLVFRTVSLTVLTSAGLYGFDVRGPSSFPKLQLHYWSNVLRILKKRIGAEVIVTGVPGTGSIESRAERMDRFLQQRARGRAINLVAHSMGGLDCRHLITHCQPEEYAPISLTTISTPHRGSPFMDWCADYIGIGKPRYDNIPSALASEANLSRTSAASTATDASKPPPQSGTQFTLASLPSSFTTLLLSLIDSPAYSNLTTNYLQNVFNPATPNDPRVKYYSIAARSEALSVWHPLWFPKMVLDGVEDRERAQAQQRGGIGDSEKDEWGNDGLVTVRSAKWGEFLGTLDGCDHWEIRGSRGLGGDFIPVPPAGISVSRDGNVNANGSGGWSWRDWGQFVGAWKREEDRRDRAAASRRGKPDPAERRTSADSDRDDVVKASTDRFSAVFDWIVDQIPASVAGKSVVAPPSEKAGKAKPSKFDLERFYIALSRKLYDDGL